MLKRGYKNSACTRVNTAVKGWSAKNKVLQKYLKTRLSRLYRTLIIEKLDEKIDISVKALKGDIEKLDTKIDASVKALDKRINTVSVGLIDMKADFRRIKLIGGAIVTLLVLPLLTELAKVVLN